MSAKRSRARRRGVQARSKELREPCHRAGSFEYIENKIRALGSPKAIGDAFEVLCCSFLLKAPQYHGLIRDVWRWQDWPGQWGPDKGIDLVAQTKDGELWAIQAKADHPDRAIPKRELDSFLSESNRPDFAYRLVIATTDDIGRNARHTIEGQEKPVGLVLRGQLLSTQIRWPTRLGGTFRPLPKKKAHPHQAKAVKDVLEGFRRHDRGQLIMACGTGKTLVALWVVQELRSRRTLVFVPSLSLITQTLSEWEHNSRKPFDYLVVCSDQTVTHRGEDHAVMSTRDLGVPVTTDPAIIRRFIAKRNRDQAAVIFCTYQSSDRIAVAHEGKIPRFDLVIADEAHRCAGHADSLFGTVLDSAKVKAKKRLFMTATPRYFTGRVKRKAEELEYELASMDDEAAFGPVFHEFTFDAAIRADQLTDYQVSVIGVTGAEIRRWVDEARLVRTRDGTQTDARTLATQIGVAKAMRRYDLRKVISFHTSVAKANRFTDDTSPESLPAVIGQMSASSRPTGQLWARHISGHTPAGRRATLLRTFGELPKKTRGVISNCACLGEGVDVPVLDGVAFVDPKRSMIDIIQAVGRVIRKAGDKKIGTVVVPVFIDDSEDADAVLSSSAFAPVWQVLRALRAHDTELAEELDELRLKLGKRPNRRTKVRLPAKIRLDLPKIVFKDFARAFRVCTVEQATGLPPLSETQILTWADQHRKRTGEYPIVLSGAIEGAPGENWSIVDQALRVGVRGLAGGSSLARLLADKRGVRNIKELPLLTEERILSWCDEYFVRHRRYPTVKSGVIKGEKGEVWFNTDQALRDGRRGLAGGSSLAKLLTEKRGKRNIAHLPPLREEVILGWADAHHRDTGRWPTAQSGSIHGTQGETWRNVQAALQQGSRGLPGGSSIAGLLADHRAVRNKFHLPPLTVDQILRWADEHFQRTGAWPNRASGPVHGEPGETWNAISLSCLRGTRGLSGGSSLSELLARHRQVGSKARQPSLTIGKILEWADEHRRVTGEWPRATSGAVTGTSETWKRIDNALRKGLRGLNGNSSLARLLAEQRGVRNVSGLPKLHVDQILRWADAHKKRTGNWPKAGSGPIPEAEHETWSKVDRALRAGCRGLRGSSSLAKVLADYRAVRNKSQLPSLTVKQILKWTDEHHGRTGSWPQAKSGPVQGAADETWNAIDSALRVGMRGLPGGSSLARFLAKHRKVRNQKALPRLIVSEILNWADRHYQRTGEWPTQKDGIVQESPEEKWRNINAALRHGTRGLPGGSSLAKLLDEHRGS